MHPKSHKELFARFAEEATRESLRDFLREGSGETRLCDFKETWPEHSVLAKHILGISNSGGGCVVVGMAEGDNGSFNPVGLARLQDKADVTNGIKSYLPTALLSAIDIVNYAFEASEYPRLVGKCFQVVFVQDEPTHIPFVALREGTGIRRNVIYIRREGQTEEASHDELQVVINRRLATGHSTKREMALAARLEELRYLYSLVRPTVSRFAEVMLWAGDPMQIANPKYPAEDFEAFVVRLIAAKKLQVEGQLAVSEVGDHPTLPR